MNPDLQARLRQIVGDNQVLTQNIETYLTDWRQRTQGQALCVVRPASAAEVAAVVQACAAATVSIVPQGGNTGLVQGSIPDASGQQVLLSLQRMNAVRSIDTDNSTIEVEAGCILQNVQAAALQAGLLFPLSLGSEGSCTIGGNLSTNAGGTQVLRYGNARDLCLGLEVVTAQGQVMHGLQGLRKDNTGYDLRDLFIGAEGTLGIITAATLKLFPLPAALQTAWVAVPSIEKAVQLLKSAHQHLGAGLTGFELMNQLSLGLVNQHFPQIHIPLWSDSTYCVLFEYADTESLEHGRERVESLLASAMDSGLVSDAVLAQNQTQSQNLWRIRESITFAQAAEGPNIKHDISLPISAIADFVRDTQAELTAAIPGVRLVNYGHLGDGNLHFNVQCPEGSQGRTFLHAFEHLANDIVYRRVQSLHGSISAEHGVGEQKIEHLKTHKDPVALSLMRQLKQALDPHNTLNPGRVLQR